MCRSVFRPGDRNSRVKIGLGWAGLGCAGLVRWVLVLWWVLWGPLCAGPFSGPVTGTGGLYRDWAWLGWARLRWFGALGLGALVGALGTSVCRPAFWPGEGNGGLYRDWAWLGWARLCWFGALGLGALGGALGTSVCRSAFRPGDRNWRVIQRLGLAGLGSAALVWCVGFGCSGGCSGDLRGPLSGPVTGTGGLYRDWAWLGWARLCWFGALGLGALGGALGTSVCRSAFRPGDRNWRVIQRLGLAGLGSAVLVWCVGFGCSGGCSGDLRVQVRFPAR